MDHLYEMVRICWLLVMPQFIVMSGISSDKLSYYDHQYNTVSYTVAVHALSIYHPTCRLTFGGSIGRA